MRFCDGELTAPETAEVRRHLEACWDCRSEVDRLQKTIAECVEYRRTVLREHLPPPPEPWKDIYAQMERIDASMAPPALWRGVWSWLRDVANPRIALPAGAAAAVLLAFVMFRETPRVQAAELLQRAVLAERSAPAKAKRLKIRTRTGSFTRLLPAAGPGPVAALFESARYDWRDPLSARAYGAWSEGLASKSDDVAEDRESFRIRTQTDSGELREASMTLRRADLRAVQGTFVFRNREWVELTELDGEGMNTAGAGPTAEPHAIPANEPALPAVAAPAQPQAASDADELQVWALLHKMQADLGEPVEVSRVEGKVRVSAVGLAVERRREIASELGALNGVEVRFDDPGGVIQSPASDASATLKAGVSPLAAGLERYLGSRLLAEQLASEALDQTDALMTRAHAIRRLMERFPAPAAATLPTAEAATLSSIERDHLVEISAQGAALQRLLSPALGAMGGTVAPALDQPDLFAAARRLEHSVSMLFGSSEVEGEVRELPTRVLSDLARVQALTRRRLASLAPAPARD